MDILVLVFGMWTVLVGFYLKPNNFISFVVLQAPIILSGFILVMKAFQDLGWITLNV